MAFFLGKSPEIMVFRALSPFSELGFSLTLAPWFAR
jgi:hypothetical protein